MEGMSSIIFGQLSHDPSKIAGYFATSLCLSTVTWTSSVSLVLTQASVNLAYPHIS